MENTIRIEDYVIARADLAGVLPDIARFERCLDDARLLRDRWRDDDQLPECTDAWSAEYLADVRQTVGEYELVLERIQEIYSGPIRSISTNNICAACQARALADHGAREPAVWAMTFTFCAHTSRSLILKGAPEKPNDFMVSVPAPEWQLREVYERLMSKFKAGFQGRLDEADGNKPTTH